MQEQICESCGKIFKAYKSNHRKYCSQKCRLKELWNIRKRREYIKIICKQCGKEFDVDKSNYRVKHNTIKYCSQNIDGNKKNNDISNLKLMTRAEHSRFHRKQDLLNGKKLFEYKYQDKELIEV